MDVAHFYADYDRHPGDRIRLFAAVAMLVPSGAQVLYPGSYVDIGPSVLFDDVTYVDQDRRAERFFLDEPGVRELVATKREDLGLAGPFRFRFVRADYREKLPLPERSIGLLISLYAGFISEHCSRYLAVGGLLLANNSHGDASMASLDPALSLAAVVKSAGGGYRIGDRNLESYLVPKQTPPTCDELRRKQRGVAYTKSPYAYVFRKSS